MKARFVLACAAAGIAASAFGGTAANAENAFSGSIGFSVDVVKPGDKVDIFGTCDDPAFTTAPVNSSILDAPDLRGRDDGTGGKALISHATVKKDATPEIWPVSFACGGEIVTGHLRVAGEEIKPGPPRVHLIHRKGQPGDEIWVGVYCDTPTSPSSAALTFGATRRAPDGRAPDLPLFDAVGTVKKVKPGDYKVSAKCGGKSISTTFTVSRGKPAAGEGTGL